MGPLPTESIGALMPEFGQVLSDFALSRYQRPALDRKTRALCTVSALVALGEEPYVANWINNAINLGATPEEITELLGQLVFYVGIPRAGRAFAAAQAVFAAHELATTEVRPSEPNNE
jgi:4-carboxymuconolactone decarboxylase